jgi:hypothetical protein
MEEVGDQLGRTIKQRKACINISNISNKSNTGSTSNIKLPIQRHPLTSS